MESADSLLRDKGAELLAELFRLLVDQRLTLSEQQLMQRLAEAGFTAFEQRSGGDFHRLFILHFTLFHLLYRLRQQLLTEAIGALEIGPLRITLLPLTSRPERQLDGHDPLADYYLDATHLTSTSTMEVDEMIGRFWSRLDRDGRRDEALATLGLEDPLAPGELKRRYRQLTMRHHPDRGGDTERLQAINAAMAILRER